MERRLVEEGARLVKGCSARQPRTKRAFRAARTSAERAATCSGGCTSFAGSYSTNAPSGRSSKNRLGVRGSTFPRFTGKKEDDKVFFTHTMHPGGEKLTPMKKIRARHPEDIMLNAIRRMLPRSVLGRDMLRKLKVYAGPEHPHQAQQPVPFEISQVSQQAGAGKAAK